MTATPDRPSGSFASLAQADSVPENWVSNIIAARGGFRAVHGRWKEPPDEAIQRLEVANKTVTPPMLHLGSDGWDEVGDHHAQRAVLRELARWCFREELNARREQRRPRVTMVVTCRDPEAFLSRYLGLVRSPFEDRDDIREDWPCLIRVKDFSVQELRRAAELGAPDVYERIRHVLPLADDESSEAIGLADGPEIFGARDSSLSPLYPAVNRHMVQALQHPVMWRALLALKPPENRLLALEGDHNAVSKLASLVIWRFAKKVETRQQQPTFFNPNGIERVLRMIAQHTATQPTGSPFHLRRDWIRPACSDDFYAELTATALFEEAVSGGLIDKVDALKWRWRHDLIRGYLEQPPALGEQDEGS